MIEEIRLTPPNTARPSSAASSTPSEGPNQFDPSASASEPAATAVMVLACTALKTKPKVTVIVTAKSTPSQRLPSARCM